MSRRFARPLATLRRVAAPAQGWPHYRRQCPLSHSWNFVAAAALVVINDMTQQKRDQAALKEAEQKYRHIFEKAIIGIFQSTPKGRFTRVNESLAKMLGYDSPDGPGYHDSGHRTTVLRRFQTPSRVQASTRRAQHTPELRDLRSTAKITPECGSLPTCVRCAKAAKS